MSSDSTESTGIASSDSEFVRGGAVILIGNPGKTLSGSTGLSLPDTSDHLLVSDGVGSSSNDVVVEVVAVNGLPVGGDFTSGDLGELETSDGGSFRLNSEGRLSSGGGTTSLSVASVSSDLDEVLGGEREGCLHQGSHVDCAGEAIVVVELVGISKGLVAVSVLSNGSPLASESDSLHAHVVSVNGDAGTSSVLGGGPGEDNRARILGDKKGGSVGTGNDNSGDREALRPGSSRASADGLDSEALSGGDRSNGGLVAVALHVLTNGSPVDLAAVAVLRELNVVTHILVVAVSEQVPGNGSELRGADLGDFSRSGDLGSSGVDHGVVQVSSGVGSAASRVAGSNLNDDRSALAVVVRSSQEGLHGDGARCGETLSIVDLVGAGVPGEELHVSEVVATDANVEFVAGDGAGALSSGPRVAEEASGVGANTELHGSGGLADSDRCHSPGGATARVSRLDSEVESSGLAVDRKLVGELAVLDGLSVVADVIVASAQVSFNSVGQSSVLSVPVEGDGVSVLDGVKSKDLSRSRGDSNSSSLGVLDRVRAISSRVAGSTLSLDVVGSTNVEVADLLLGVEARVSVVDSTEVVHRRVVSHASDGAVGKAVPLGLVSEVVDGDTSELAIVLRDGGSVGDGLGPANADTASLEVNLDLRSRRRGKSDNWDFNDSGADSSTGLRIGGRDLHSVEVNVRLNLDSVRSTVGRLEVVDSVVDVAAVLALLTVRVNVDRVGVSRDLVPGDSELSSSLLSDRSVKDGSDGARSRSESSSSSNSYRSLSSGTDSNTSDLNDVTGILVELVDLAEGLNGARAGEVVLSVSKVVLDLSALLESSPGGALAIVGSVAVLNSVGLNSSSASILRGIPVEGHVVATSSGGDVDGAGNTNDNDRGAALVGGLTARALADGSDSEASSDGSAQVRSNLVDDVLRVGVLRSVLSIKGRPLLAVAAELLSASPFNEVALASSSPGDRVTIDGVQEGSRRGSGGGESVPGSAGHDHRVTTVVVGNGQHGNGASLSETNALQLSVGECASFLSSSGVLANRSRLSVRVKNLDSDGVDGISPGDGEVAAVVVESSLHLLGLVADGNSVGAVNEDGLSLLSVVSNRSDSVSLRSNKVSLTSEGVSLEVLGASVELGGQNSSVKSLPDSVSGSVTVSDPGESDGVNGGLVVVTTELRDSSDLDDRASSGSDGGVNDRGERALDRLVVLIQSNGSDADLVVDSGN